MTPDKPGDRCIPSREIAYAFTAAMAFAQRFEMNLRAILYAADYHGWISLELTKQERQRFKDTEALVDGATCGKVVEALKRSKWISSKAVFERFTRAIRHRNNLAHKFLAALPETSPTKTEEKEIVRGLHVMTLDLYTALSITDALRAKVEAQADKEHVALQELGKEIGMTFENPERHYATRAKRKKELSELKGTMA
jgi:hypothetical protein